VCAAGWFGTADPAVVQAQSRNAVALSPATRERIRP
jgi:hypothetical protein